VIGWPIAVLATELLYPTIVPWYSAEQVAGAPALCQLAEVGGPLLVGACLAAANAGFASALVCLRANGARGWRPLAATIAGGAALLGYGHLRLLALDRSTRDAPAAQVAVVQPNLTRETQRDPATLARALALTADRSREAGALVVWPESVFDHLVEESERADWGAALARAMGPRPSERSPVLVGAYLAPASGPMRPSNALLLLDREGTIAGIYRKQKPLMFGEYVPFADVFPALDRWLPHAGRLTAGTSFEPLVVAGHRVAPLVCYEDLIPSFVREAVRRERPELLVDASNDAWFGHSSAWQHHVALATFRAIEHRLFFVRAGNDAGSVVVDPGGRIVASVAPYHAGSLSHEVRWLTIETPYARWGDAPLALACAALSLAQLARARRGSARTLGARATRITTPLVSPRYANPYAGTPVSRRVP
jgi:apolipoprotein N-acyltransferase